MLVHNTNLVPLRQLAIFDAEYPSEAAVAPTATHLANWWPDNKLQTVTCACVHTGTAQVLLPVRLVPFVTTMRAQHCAVARYVHIYICIYVYIYMYIYICIPGASFARSPHLVIVIRTARSNITIRSQTNSLAMPGRLPFTGRTVVSPVWPDLDRTWGAVTVGTHQTSRGWGLPLSLSISFLLSPSFKRGSSISHRSNLPDFSENFSLFYRITEMEGRYLKYLSL